jgi:asparagine synthase (glutamine-hydrolysing)
MCGIAGIVSFDGRCELRNSATAMQAQLRHRGPDDEGLYVDSFGVAAFVHTRLAILDLSAAGHQPMLSPCERYVIVFNGEIYNFQKLRTNLQARGVVFRTGTDTEVLLQLYVAFGEECVHHLEGMFAFAIWDNHDRHLFLARDPLGIKPVYVWQVGATLAFASELAPLLASRLEPVAVDAPAVFDYLRFGSVQEPATLVQNVALLRAGHCLSWTQGVAVI